MTLFKPVHNTTYEDEQMTGVTCDGVFVGQITAHENEPWVCDRCGAVLRLIWDVRLEEVETK